MDNPSKKTPIGHMLCLCVLLLFSWSATAQTKRALVIGLGQQQDKAWNKINGDKDVPMVQEMLRHAGFGSVTTLVNQQATKAGITGALKQMAAVCRPGDVVYVHYSGHGQQMTDVHHDEADGLDECWIPYDACRKASSTYHGEKHLTDDELNIYLQAIRRRIGAKGKLLVVIDACHSGDGTRGADDEEVARGVEDTLTVDASHARGLMDAFVAVKEWMLGVMGQKTAAGPKASPLPEKWITLSACLSHQVNYEMTHPAVGKLTYALWQEMKKGTKSDNRELMKRISRFVNTHTASRPQQPEMTGDDIKKYKITDILNK